MGDFACAEVAGIEVSKSEIAVGLEIVGVAVVGELESETELSPS
jgi:hypothetical protein